MYVCVQGTAFIFAAESFHDITYATVAPEIRADVAPSVEEFTLDDATTTTTTTTTMKEARVMHRRRKLMAAKQVTMQLILSTHVVLQFFQLCRGVYVAI